MVAEVTPGSVHGAKGRAEMQVIAMRGEDSSTACSSPRAVTLVYKPQAKAKQLHAVLAGCLCGTGCIRATEGYA